MERGTKLIILIVIGALVIVGIVFFVLSGGFGSKPPSSTANNNTNKPTNGLTNANTNVNTAPLVQNTNSNTPPKPVVTELPESVRVSSQVKNIAIVFAERLGSYSNQSNFKNLDDLEPLVTDSVNTFLQKEYKDRLQKTFPSTPGYYGVSTRVGTYTVDSESANEVDATLTVQKTESGTVSAVTSGTLALTLEKIGDAWIVSYLKWK